jgi:ATP-binding cassette subfamily G (WHITE) protein 2 (PDR)
MEEVHALARSMSRQSVSSQGSRTGGRLSGALHRTVTSGSVVADPWNYEEGSDLDPYSPNFSIRKWTRSIVTEARGEDHIPRYAGIAFKNMSIHGFGSDAGELMADVAVGADKARITRLASPWSRGPSPRYRLVRVQMT